MSLCKTLPEWARGGENPVWSEEKAAVDRERRSSQQQRMELIVLGSVPHPPELCHHLKPYPRRQPTIIREGAPASDLQLLEPYLRIGKDIGVL